MEHQRYKMSHSVTATSMNSDGNPCPKGELCDQLSIGYGTGMVTGEFVRDQMCFGNGSSCIQCTAVMALEMSNQPFRSFRFDGILGLGLKQLAINPEFNFLQRLMDIEAANFQFGVFLNDGASEIAIGGYNSNRVLTPLSWAPVAKVSLGHWQVRIKELKIAGRTLDVCKDGSCHGILDTGTTHLGVPGSNFDEFMKMLSVDSGGAASCADVAAPEVEIVLEGFALMLGPRHYMRPLPLDKGVNLTQLTGGGVNQGSKNTNNNSTNEVEPASALPVVAALTEHASNANLTSQTCVARLMPVNFPEPLGPKLFLLGEPVLHRYYAVFDWKAEAIGFGISDTAHNRRELQASQSVEQGLSEDQVALVQLLVSVRVRRHGSHWAQQQLTAASIG